MLKKIKSKLRSHADDVLINKIKPYTLCGPDRIKTLIKLSKDLNLKKIEGDFVECGTYMGGTAAILAKYMSEARQIWLYDSFEGMPETTEKDGSDAKGWVGRCVGSVKDVKEIMKLLSICEERYIIKKGWFDQTFREELPNKVALLHCDADWYDSVSIVLDTFYHLIPEGGCVILDDFGHWEGSREAFYDFCIRHNEKPLLERVGNGQAYWIKGKLHNRG